MPSLTAMGRRLPCRTALIRHELNLAPARSNPRRHDDCIHTDRRRLTMIRFLLRTLGLLFLAASFVFVVYDGTKSIAANALVYTRVDEFWSLVHAASLQQ